MPPKEYPTRPKPNIRPVPVRRDPRSPDEWQSVVDSADVLLLIDSAQQYGLVVGGPKVNIARCNEMLAAGAEGGFFPSEPVRRRETIGAWLWHERTRLGLAQHALAARVGTNQVRISQIERGLVNISVDELTRLRTALLLAARTHAGEGVEHGS